MFKILLMYTVIGFLFKINVSTNVLRDPIYLKRPIASRHENALRNEQFPLQLETKSPRSRSNLIQK